MAHLSDYIPVVVIAAIVSSFATLLGVLYTQHNSKVLALEKQRQDHRRYLREHVAQLVVAVGDYTNSQFGMSAMLAKGMDVALMGQFFETDSGKLMLSSRTTINEKFAILQLSILEPKAKAALQEIENRLEVAVLQLTKISEAKSKNTGNTAGMKEFADTLLELEKVRSSIKDLVREMSVLTQEPLEKPIRLKSASKWLGKFFRALNLKMKSLLS